LDNFFYAFTQSLRSSHGTLPSATPLQQRRWLNVFVKVYEGTAIGPWAAEPFDARAFLVPFEMRATVAGVYLHINVCVRGGMMAGKKHQR
jgi:hypothetical protein